MFILHVRKRHLLTNRRGRLYGVWPAWEPAEHICRWKPSWPRSASQSLLDSEAALSPSLHWSFLQSRQRHKDRRDRSQALEGGQLSRLLHGCNKSQEVSDSVELERGKQAASSPADEAWERWRALHSFIDAGYIRPALLFLEWKRLRNWWKNISSDGAALLR